MKKIVTLVLALVLIAAVAVASADKLVVGASSTPHGEILEAAKPVLAEKGVELEIVIYDDYVQPNVQLDGGDIDANYFQHSAYLNNFNTEYGTKLAVLGAVHYEPMGIYVNQDKKPDFAAIADGATIAVPNDPTNETRALRLLEAQGLITLPAAPEDGSELNLTALDIVDNPKSIEIVEVEAATVPRTLADTDFAVINSNYALQAGPDMVGAAVASESSDIAFPNVVAIREGDENPDLKTLIEVLQSQDIVDFITTTYGSAVIPTTEY